MFLSKSLFILLLPTLLEARALKRNVCDWVNAEPVLYQEYDGDSCPPANELLPDGECSISTSTRPPCANFCQIRTTFRFGQEQPYPANRGYCHGPLTCTITDTTTTTWTGSLNLPVAVKYADIFTLGVTGGFAHSNAVAKAEAPAVTLQDGECGYFTFLPILKDVCGSWTQGEIFTANFDSPVVCINNATTANMCSTSLQLNNDDGVFSSPTARGDTVFVKVDCGTHAPLPIDQQDPAYQHDGVALPRALSDAYSQVFAKMDSAANATISVIPAPSCANQSPAPALLDCLNATAVLVSSPQTLVLHGKNGGKSWSSAIDSCAIEIEYTQDWDASCNVNFAEVFSVVGDLMDSCLDITSGSVGAGSLPLRNDGKCNSQVSIVATNGTAQPNGQ